MGDDVALSDVYLIFRGKRILYKGGRYGFQLLLNYLDNLRDLTFRVIKKRRNSQAHYNSPLIHRDSIVECEHFKPKRKKRRRKVAVSG